jgi:predicted dehydrogenase
MPKRLRAFCQFGQWHNIEVEDQVTAYFEYADGATGLFQSSTGETPGTNRFEIAGTKGRLVMENGRIQFTRNEVDSLEWSRTAKVGFSKPEVWNIDIPFADAAGQHALLMQNFVAAIFDGVPLIAPGSEGVHSVELANAMVYSSLTGQTLDLPLDGNAWEQKLHQLIAESKHAKEVRDVATDDFSASFRR